jgi:hypothetical protein
MSFQPILMTGRVSLDDLINVLMILGFFALTWGFVRLCDRLWGRPPC